MDRELNVIIWNLMLSSSMLGLPSSLGVRMRDSRELMRADSEQPVPLTVRPIPLTVRPVSLSGHAPPLVEQVTSAARSRVETTWRPEELRLAHSTLHHPRDSQTSFRRRDFDRGRVDEMKSASTCPGQLAVNQ
ncbi:hypothetical protein [Gordonia sp. NPDC058843]|uniref:hypothetical protein n=1 Tax=Gordonia sp. NPDC058843 TaxID=3346648 RepID=UPI0036A47BE3